MLNNRQRDALNIIKERKNLFLTGSPGTGKSFTLSEIVLYLKNSDINYGVTALTGCAAILIKGQTLHSFLSLGLGTEKNEKIVEKIKKFRPKYKKLYELKVLIIDEISMMDTTLFEKVSQILSIIKENKKPFGGIQLVLIGDFFQLAPISGEYCFTSDLWNMLELITIQLTELVRQKDDTEFQKILQQLRKGKCTTKTYNRLLNLKNTEFPPHIVPTKLYSLNVNIDVINKNEFIKLYKSNNNISLNKPFNINDVPVQNYYPIVDNFQDLDLNLDLKNSTESDLKTIYRYNVITNNAKINKEDYVVSLIVGLKIIITRNIDITKGLVNGTMGTIISLYPSYVFIKDIYDNIHLICYYTDKNENDKSYVSFLPIKTAYALSIHKSQGSTLDAVEIDGGINIFTSGQLYTALSRAKTMKYVKIIDLDKGSFMTSTKVKEFYENL